MRHCFMRDKCTAFCLGCTALISTHGVGFIRISWWCTQLALSSYSNVAMATFGANWFYWPLYTDKNIAVDCDCCRTALSNYAKTIAHVCRASELRVWLDDISRYSDEGRGTAQSNCSDFDHSDRPTSAGSGSSEWQRPSRVTDERNAHLTGWKQSAENALTYTRWLEMSAFVVFCRLHCFICVYWLYLWL